MSTCYDSPATALSLLDFTAPLEFEMPDHEVSTDYAWAPAWSSSELGDPTVDDEDFLDQVHEYGPGAGAPRATSGAAIAAVVLGALGVGALLGVAVLDLAEAARASKAVVVPSAQFAAVPASPQAGGQYPAMTITVPTPGVPPMATTLPVSEFPPAQHLPPTVRVLPCDPQPFCV